MWEKALHKIYKGPPELTIDDWNKIAKGLNVPLVNRRSSVLAHEQLLKSLTSYGLWFNGYRNLSQLIQLLAEINTEQSSNVFYF